MSHGCQFMSKIFLFNFLSADDIPHATDLLKKENPILFENDHLNQDYFTCDPMGIDGRSAGLPGQSSSTNGCEKQGGILKVHHKDEIKWLCKDEKKNPLHLIASVAKDVEMSHSASTSFASKPVCHSFHYDFVRMLGKHSLPGNANIACDLLYMICKERIDGCIIKTSHVIGDSNVSFVASMPTGSCVFTCVNQMCEDRRLGNCSGPFISQMHSLQTETESNTVKGCKKILRYMTEDDKKELKDLLIHKLTMDSSEPKVGETLCQYLRRRAHRNAVLHTQKSNSAYKAKKVKERMKRDLELEAEKWPDETQGNKRGRKRSSKKKDDLHLGDIDFEEYDGVCYFGENDDEDDIMNVLDIIEDEELIQENPSFITQMYEDQTQVRQNKELGDWINVCIDAECKCVTCNCEDFVYNGVCHHSVMFSVLQFNDIPSAENRMGSEDWEQLRKNAMDVIKATYIE